MLLTRPDVVYNFKYLENIDGTPSIDFTDGYCAINMNSEMM
jgi:hypothetical protein